MGRVNRPVEPPVQGWTGRSTEY